MLRRVTSLMILLLPMGCMVAAAPQRPAPAGGTTLTTQLTARGTRAVLGDPVLLTLSVKNVSSQPISLLRPQIQPPIHTTVIIRLLRPQSGSYATIQAAGAARRINKMFSPPRFPVLKLAPGAKQTFNLVLDCGDTGANEPDYLFAKTGQYKIKVTLYRLLKPTREATVYSAAGLTPIHTAPVAVTVLKPSSEAEIKAYEDLRKLPSHLYMYAPGAMSTIIPSAVIEQFRTFQEEHANSRYSEFMNLALLLHNFEQGRLQSRQADASRAMSRVQSLTAKKEWPPGWRAKAAQLHRAMSAATARRLRLGG